MADDEVVIHWDPDTNTTGGYCESCGDPVEGRRRKCDNCKASTKTAATLAKQDSTQDNQRRAPKVQVRKVGGAVTPTKAAGTFAKLLILITVAWAWSAVKKYGIPDVDGRLAETLAFTDEEAADIARPLGRLSMSNTASAKLIAPIVENDDLIDAGFALWEWRKRVDTELARYKGNMIADNQRGGAVNVNTGQDAQSTGDGGGYDPLAAGYDGGRDARVI